jgi:ABC-type transport system involved in multi-copper enzyme maturation permease subunit
MTLLWPGWERDRPSPNGFFDLLEGLIMLPALLVILGGIVAGASMVGAEWQAGSFVTLLAWEPRRSRLLVARMIVSALLGFVISVALLALFTVALLPTAAVKGAPVGPGGDWWVTYAGVVLRLGGLTGLAAATGAALAMIGKRTALAVFAVFGYLIAGELIIRNFWEASRPWMLLRNVSLVLGGEDLVPDGGSVLSGLVVVGAYSAVMMVAALALFGRRDFASAG